MKKIYTIMVAILISSATISAQTSTEVFETEGTGSTTFTDNGVVFNILSGTGLFLIDGKYPTTGWNGTAKDNVYIDNDGSGNVSTSASFSIKTTSNLFKVNRFWVFLSASNLNQNVTGSLTVMGKLNGVTQFTQVKTSGFTTSTATNNGYTLIDLKNLNVQNYSNIIIDQLQLTIGGGNFNYMALDAFTWVKDAGVVLGTDEISKKDNLSIVFNSSLKVIDIYNAKEIENVEIYESSGKLVKKVLNSTKIDVEELAKGIYIAKVKTKNKVLSSKFIVK